MPKLILLSIAACGLLTAQTVVTQTVSPGESNPPPQNSTFFTSGFAMPGVAGETIGIVSHEFSFNSGSPIAGAPYSAEQVTEHVQTLADGNRIVNTTTTKTYRDSQGRTRTETMLPTPAGGSPAPVLVTIDDPVAGVTYLLNPTQKTAHKLAKVVDFPKTRAALALPLPPLPATGDGGPMVYTRQATLPKTDVKTENLGSQTIDGLIVTGTRRTETIPAGAIGNEGPIETTIEKWFSPALQVTVKSIRNDPRMGQITETLNNLNRGEPDAALFQPPADYTVTDNKNPGPNNTLILKQPQ
ncbi:MAG: hypothetical protein JO340_10720 [Acidobacteriaceae bacterium]|nr:hypothetical protein [Acidobacteriaceae bacterium]